MRDRNQLMRHVVYSRWDCRCCDTVSQLTKLFSIDFSFFRRGMLTVPIRNKYSYFVVKLDCSRVLRFGYVEGLEKYILSRAKPVENTSVVWRNAYRPDNLEYPILTRSLRQEKWFFEAVPHDVVARCFSLCKSSTPNLDIIRGQRAINNVWNLFVSTPIPIPLLSTIILHQIDNARRRCSTMGVPLLFETLYCVVHGWQPHAFKQRAR